MSTTSLGPTGRTAARRARPYVLFGALLLVVVTVGLVLLFTSGDTTTARSTESAEPDGTRALAELLRDQGVQVEESTSPSDAAETATSDTTLVVADTTFLTERAARRIRDTDADLVLVAPLPTRLPDLAPGVIVDGTAGGQPTLPPRCALPAATNAGPADVGQASTYRVVGDVDATSCYLAENDAAALVQLHDGDRTVTVVGSAFPFQNGGLASEGNAALTMNLLGAHERLTWLLPDYESAAGQQTGSLADLAPMPARIAIIGVIGAVALFAVARARRLGPVVAERLPIVVRATETTEGRARLYRSLRARERAATALRRGTVSRLRPPLQLPRDATPDAVVAAVTRRVDRDPAEVHELLFGTAPADDAALVRLADDLDALEREIRQP